MKALGIDVVEWVALLTIIGFISGIVSWFVHLMLQPLHHDINDLNASISALRETIDREADRREMLEKEVDEHEWRITTLEKKGGDEHDQSN